MNEWIKWDGGERPVPSSASVQYQLRSEPTSLRDSSSCAAAIALYWDHRGNDHDIIAYRVVSV